MPFIRAPNPLCVLCASSRRSGGASAGCLNAAAALLALSPDAVASRAAMSAQRPRRRNANQGATGCGLGAATLLAACSTDIAGTDRNTRSRSRPPRSDTMAQP